MFLSSNNHFHLFFTIIIVLAHRLLNVTKNVTKKRFYGKECNFVHFPDFSFDTIEKSETLMYELLVLALLMHWPLHAYKIVTMARNILGPEERLSTGTLSTLLARLEQTNLIRPTEPGSAPFPTDRSSHAYDLMRLKTAQWRLELEWGEALREQILSRLKQDEGTAITRSEL